MKRTSRETATRGAGRGDERRDKEERSERGVQASYAVALPLVAVTPGTVGLLAVVALVVLIVLYVLLRGGQKQLEEEERPEIEEAEKPTDDLLEEREEVEKPVEDYEDMSLAEIKKAKMARVKEDGEGRKTAGEATEEARKEHDEPDEEEAEEVAEADVQEPEEEAPSETPEAEEEEAEEEEAEEAKQEDEEDEDEDGGGLGMSIPSPDELSEASDVEEEESDEEAREEAEDDEETSEASEASDESGEEPDDDSSGEGGSGAPGAGSDDGAAEEPVAEAEEEESTPSGPEPDDESVEEEPQEEAPAREDREQEKRGDAETLHDQDAEPKSFEKGLKKTREGFIDQLSNLFSGESLDPEIVEQVEEVLFSADIGPRVAQDILDAIEEQLSGEDLEEPGKVWGFIRHYTEELLQAHEEKLDVTEDKPFVVLVVGVNGVGKTTTIGKMASRFKSEGKSVLLVAGDTFRAAAVDQLGIWAERTGLPMHREEEGADPASVIYSGVERAIEEDIDVVLCDTSGRLHTDVNLMEELEKMERVAGNAKEGAPHEVHLVLDANTGQNAIQQAEKFSESLDVSGMTLTKFDGTARGGVILGVCKRFDAPVRYVGIGERVVDLREFDAEEFVEALFM